MITMYPSVIFAFRQYSQTCISCSQCSFFRILLDNIFGLKLFNVLYFNEFSLKILIPFMNFLLICQSQRLGTALCRAAQRGHIDCMRHLLDHGADKEAKDDWVRA